MQPNTIIIGGGIAGLTAARQLQQSGIDFVILEASDRVGGRVKTDLLDHYRLDYGFQVLLTAYPEAQRWLNYDQLNLQAFLPGAQLLLPDGSQSLLGDPLRNMSSLIPTILSEAGTISDKLKILKLRYHLRRKSIDEIFEANELPTMDALRGEYGFSQQIIDQFFNSFFAGIFLDKELKSSKRMFDFVFKMFGEGNTAIPNLGMEEIPKQLAAPIPASAINTNVRVAKIDGQSVQLTDGGSLSAPNIIIATEAKGLIKEYQTVNSTFQSTTHIHFVASQPPIKKPIIALITNKESLVNNLCTINLVAQGYAKKDYLVSLSVVGKHQFANKELIRMVRKELSAWFGNSVNDWQHLHSRDILYALPNQTHVQNSLKHAQYQIRSGLHLCGDHLLNGSINAAMKTGREVAELIIAKEK